MLCSIRRQNCGRAGLLPFTDPYVCSLCVRALIKARLGNQAIAMLG